MKTKFDQVQFEERFATDDAHHSFTLTADGCMNRMKDPSPFRELELDNRLERFAGSAESDERTIMNYVFILANHGLQPSNRETIEMFIIKHMDIINQYK